MPSDILFIDIARQDEIETFYKSLINIQQNEVCIYLSKVLPSLYVQSLLATLSMVLCIAAFSLSPSWFISPEVHGMATSQASQMHRDYYRGFPKAHHPLLYFREPQYLWQCGPEMTTTYLSNPMYHVGYKHPAVLPLTRSLIPPLPERSLAPRYNKPACKAFTR